MTNPLKGDAFLAKLAELVNQQNPDVPPITGDQLAEDVMNGIDAAVRKAQGSNDD